MSEFNRAAIEARLKVNAEINEIFKTENEGSPGNIFAADVRAALDEIDRLEGVIEELEKKLRPPGHHDVDEFYTE